MAKQPRQNDRRILNRRARYEYHIVETVEAGIVLKGSEVKSLRDGRASIEEAYARIANGQVVLIGCNIQTYPPATTRNHDPLRDRRLLLHHREIRKLLAKVTQAGYTLVPLSIFFNDRGLAKVELALVRGKTHADKREDIRKREHQRDIDRAMRRK
ncbi:MAG: SsrA-binding protein SmpB [Phycisphaerae bacterium]